MQSDHRFINALLRRPVDRTPVWVMRQAGRYLPEYRKIRQQAGGFMDLCTNPDLACEVTLQPIRRFDLDAAIIFSDILTIPNAMGLGLYFTPGEGPTFERAIEYEKDVDILPNIDVEEKLSYVIEAIQNVRREIDGKVPIIGFSGSPWTVGCYMVEGKGNSKNAFPKMMKMLYNRPDLLHKLLNKLSDATVNYLNAQIEAGAEALMIFDTWGGLLSPQRYIEFSQNYMANIVSKLNVNKTEQIIPVILFTKGGAKNLSGFAKSGAHAIGLDWTVNLSDVKKQVGNQLALQGNLNPSVLSSSPKTIEQEVMRVLEDYGTVGKGQGHVFNLGHGITPDVPPEHVAVLIESIKKHSPKYHV